MSNGISVVICCYNSAARLPATLQHLAKQQVTSHFPWEIVLVNNASTDNTVEVAKSEWEKYTVKQTDFNIVQQPIPGLSNAREKGVKESRYEYIIFCDDDNWLDENYIENACQLMKLNPKVGAAGGQSVAVSEIDLPEWFDEYKNGYAIGMQTADTRDTTMRKAVWGAGMVTRRSLFLKVFSNSYPSLLTDRKGKHLSAGGDSEFVMRLLFIGCRLYNDNNLTFQHFIAKERLTEDYRIRLFRGFEESGLVLYPYSRQADIALLTNVEKPVYFLKRFIKFLVSRKWRVKDWDYMHEALLIYHLTGIQFVKVDDVSKSVRQLYLNLKNERGNG